MESKAILSLINQIFEIEKKINSAGQTDRFNRNFKRIYFELEEGFNIVIKNPTGEFYNEGRIDCEANIVGNVSSKMMVQETIKPIIYEKNNNNLQIVQRGVVIVSAK
jgi:hypothetical protein